MVTTIEANTPELRNLVDRTRQGEEVVLTVDGKPESRVRADSASVGARAVRVVDWAAHVRELEEHLYDGVTGIPGTPSEQIFEEMREERL
jgi:hypothetical protein